jgi:hypothetical protein
MKLWPGRRRRSAQRFTQGRAAACSFFVKRSEPLSESEPSAADARQAAESSAANVGRTDRSNQEEEPAAPSIASELVFAAGLGGIGFGLLALDELALYHTPLAVQIAVTAFLVGLPVYGTYQLYRHALRPLDDAKPANRVRRAAENPDTPYEAAVVGIVYLVVWFVSLTALLLRHKALLHVVGAPRSDGGLVYLTAESYAWNLTNAVPVLNLTETFDWHSAIQFTNEWGRILVLVFKLALIVPLFGLASKVWR